MKTLRETIEFLTSHDGDQPRAEIEELVTDVMRALVREEEAEKEQRMRAIDVVRPDFGDAA